MENNKIINGNCWIAYFDILGFESLLNELKGHLDIVARTYEEILAFIEKDVRIWRDSVDAIWASDSFLFYTFDDSPQSFTIINIVAQHYFVGRIWKRKPLRGALSFGEFYSDKEKGIYVGPGLSDAYKYAEKQDWIGFVMTPDACKNLRGTKLSEDLDNGGLNFSRYSVPVKKKEKNDGLITIKETNEQLYAFKMTCFDYNNSNLTESRIKEMMYSAQNNNTAKDGSVVKKYENTLNFIQYYTKISL